jgi:hypothetical protein
MPVMNWRKLSPCLGVLYLLFVCVAGTCREQDESDDPKVLLKERRDLLSEAFTQMWTIYRQLPRNITVQELLQAERDSFKADLDWFEKADERIKALETHKLAANNIWDLAKAKFRAGVLPEYVSLQARAHVLEIQVELLREKRKQKVKN